MKLKDGDLMLLADAAITLGLSPEMVTKLRRSGKLPSIKTQGGWFIFLTRDVRALAEKRRKAPRGWRRGQVRVAPP